MIGSDGPTFSAPEDRNEYVPGQLLLRVTPAAIRPHFPSAMRMTKASAERVPDAVAEPIDYLRRNAGLKTVQPLFTKRQPPSQRTTLNRGELARLAMARSVAQAGHEQLAGLTIASLPAKHLTPSLLKTISASPGIEFAEPMPARWLAAVDPMRNCQWGLAATRWLEARRPSAAAIGLAVLDTGLDATHPDLKGLSAPYHREGLRAEDIVGHGTHVAGIASAIANNDVGIAGVTDCRLSAWKIFPDEPQGGDFYVDSERYLRALEATLDRDVKVVNLSIAGTASSQTEALLFRALVEGGVLPVAAMGNEYQAGNPTSYPAAYEGVLAVGASDETRKRAPFSNTGEHIGLMAPGSNILSTLPMRRSTYRVETRYASWSGTSMATPYVAGAAALVAAQHPEWKPVRIAKRLRDTASQVPDMDGHAWTHDHGSGLLDVKRALSSRRT